MSEIFDHKNLVMFGLQRPNPVFEGNFCRQRDPLTCAHHSVHSQRFKECGWFSSWGDALGTIEFKKVRYTKTSVCQHGKDTWKINVLFEGEGFSAPATTADPDSPLDGSLVARYQELCELETDGCLSDEQEAELRQIERQLDDQERAASELCAPERSLDEEIERLRKLIELTRQALSIM